MAYEVFKTVRNGVFVTPGHVRIAKLGRARFCLEDIRHVGIVTHATVLIDRKARRIGLRAPREGESPMLVRQSAAELKTADIWISGALQAIGVSIARGGKTLPIEVGDGVLSIEFPEQVP